MTGAHLTAELKQIIAHEYSLEIKDFMKMIHPVIKGGTSY